MTIATITTIEEAQADLARMEAEHAEWGRKRDALARRLGALEGGAAEAALAGGDSSQVAATITTLREELRIADGAIAILDGAIAILADRLPAARRAVLVARVEAQRAAVAPLKEAADDRLAEYEGKLADLAAWEVGDGRTPPRPVQWLAEDGRKVYLFIGQTAAMLEDFTAARGALRRVEAELRRDDEGGRR